MHRMRWKDMLCEQYACRIITTSNDLSENILGYSGCLAENYQKYHELVRSCRLKTKLMLQSPCLIGSYQLLVRMFQKGWGIPFLIPISVTGYN